MTRRHRTFAAASLLISASLFFVSEAEADTSSISKLVSAIAVMSDALPQNETFASALDGVLQVRLPPVTCPTALTIEPSALVATTLVGFLNETSCRPPAPLMILQLGLQDEVSAQVPNIRSGFSARFGKPCYDGLDQMAGFSEPASRLVAWKREHSLVVMSWVGSGGTNATLTLFATDLKPKTDAARDRYRAVVSTVAANVPNSCF